MKILLIAIIFSIVFVIPAAYSQQIVPPQPEPPSPPFQLPIEPPKQQFPSKDLFTKPEPSTELWDTLAPMPTPRTEVAVASVHEKIYVIAGMDKEGRAIDTVEVYDTITNTC